MRKSSTSCCAPVLAGRLEAKQAEELAETFRALGDPGRLRLLSFLAAQPGGEACVCNLTGPLGLSQPTVSHHLKVLTEAGLLERERRATWIYYRLRLERLGELCAALIPPKRLARSIQRRAASAGS
ncbi:MAG TPA: metalloregulator ArsR/SmtB family transcription factor [Myxococcota bacterium]|nr:metalloregulator ArsR/SmtB family transcription factor [Myxococcota bacterium]